MNSDRHYVVEADTPSGPVELSGNYTSAVPRADVIADIVDDYANQSGLTPDQIQVTDVWHVNA